VSSRGYGILWDNTSFTRFGDLTDSVPLPGTTGLLRGRRAWPATSARPRGNTKDWSGTVTPHGDRRLHFRTYSSGTVQLTVNSQMVINHWRQNWLPNEDIAHVTLTAGQRCRCACNGTATAMNIIPLVVEAAGQQPYHLVLVPGG